MGKTLPLDRVYPNPEQPRTIFERGKLEELAASIKAQGLLQPIRVRPDGAGRFMIVAGERRYRAHLLAGLTEIRAEVVELSDDELADQAIIENLQREDITPLEEARAYQKRLDRGYSVEQLAERLGLKQPWRIRERLSLLKLRPEYQGLLGKGILSPSQGFEMSRLSPSGQDALFRLIGAGACKTYNQLRACADGLLEQEQQSTLFDLPEPPTPEEQAKLTRLESLVESLCKLLGQGFKDGEIVVVKKINPHRAGLMAEQLTLIQGSLAKLEKALRKSAVQLELGP